MKKTLSEYSLFLGKPRKKTEIIASTKAKEPESANITSLNKTVNLSGIQGY